MKQLNLKIEKCGDCPYIYTKWNVCGYFCSHRDGKYVTVTPSKLYSDCPLNDDNENKPIEPHWPGYYQPEELHIFYHFGGRYAYSNDFKSSQAARAFGACSKTIEESEQVFESAKIRLQIIDRLVELNDGWRPDWEDRDQRKYVISYYYRDNETVISGYNEVQILPSMFYAKSDKIWQQIIDEIGEAAIIQAMWGL